MPERSKGVDLKSSGLRPREFESRSGRFGAASSVHLYGQGIPAAVATTEFSRAMAPPNIFNMQHGGQLGFRFESVGQADVHAARSARAQDSLVMVPLSWCEI